MKTIKNIDLHESRIHKVTHHNRYSAAVMNMLWNIVPVFEKLVQFGCFYVSFFDIGI